MVINNYGSLNFMPGPANFGGFMPHFQSVRRAAENCPCARHRNFFRDNQDAIRQRCAPRNPYDYRTERDGRRFENGRMAQTQILQQGDSSAVIQAGENRLTFNKADQSVLMQNADGSSRTIDLKVWGDPHVQLNGREVGTVKNDLAFQFNDGTQVSLLMGNGHGGAPVDGQQSFVDTAMVRTPDGTGAVVSGISGPGRLGVTPMDSSYSSELMANQALNKFGTYAPAWVNVQRNGALVDANSGQMVHDQYGLNRLDEQQQRNEAARNLYNQGYVPQHLAAQYDRPYYQYDDQMRSQCHSYMSDMLQRIGHMQSRLGADMGQLQMLLAQHQMQGAGGWQGWHGQHHFPRWA